MGESTPIIIGSVGTLIALAMFINGWRMRNSGSTGVKLGGLHMRWRRSLFR